MFLEKQVKLLLIAQTNVVVVNIDKIISYDTLNIKNKS